MGAGRREKEGAHLELFRNPSQLYKGNRNVMLRNQCLDRQLTTESPLRWYLEHLTLWLGNLGCI